MIGIDIIEIDRIKTALKRTKSFYQKAFTQYEREYYEKNGQKIQTLAGFFCAKEAAVKALNTGFNGISLQDLEVRHTESGSPYLVFLGKAKELLGDRAAEISISHSKNYAVAVCLIR
ncbi:MAG TPA: holo-ACP synthase [Clostridia bacterium]